MEYRKNGYYQTKIDYVSRRVPEKKTVDVFLDITEANHWDIQFCGKEAMRMHRTDYTVTVGSSQYTLDQHIKHGIHAEELIRIYFCWDDESRKILIGSMPGHLATVRNST